MVSVSFLGGATAFWISDVIVNDLDPNQQGYAVTVLCPVALGLFYALMLRLRKADRSGPSTAIFSVCGMWVLAIWFALLAQSIRGSGFREAFTGVGDPRFIGYLIVSSFLPSRIFLFITMEGNIIALLIGTIAMLTCHFAFESTRWVLPPRVLSVFRPANR